MCPFQLFQTGFNGITDIKTLILVIKAYIDHCIQISAVRKTSQPPFNPIQVNDPFLYPLKTSTHVGGSVVVWGRGGGGIGMLISVELMKIFTPEFFHAALECLQKCFEGFLLTPLKTLQNLWFSCGFPIFSRQNKEKAFLTSFKYCKIK